MTKNKLTDLNDHLFAQLERLNDEQLTPEQVKNETARALAISKVASQIVSNANVSMRAAELAIKHKHDGTELPSMLGVTPKPVPMKGISYKDGGND